MSEETIKQIMNDSMEELSEMFFMNKTPESILEMDAVAGDLHNNGKSTAIISTDAGKIVYKPRDLSVDSVYREFAERFFSDVTYVPKVLRADGYGFCEYIDNCPSAGKENAEKYYRNLGGTLVMIQILGTNDLHHSNVLARDNMPVLIDNETAIGPSHYKRAMEINSVIKDTNRSLLRSGIFPYGKGKSQLSFMFDISDKNRSAPVVDGKKTTADEFENEIIEGYIEKYSYCMKHRNEIREFLIKFSDVSLRHVIRETSEYVFLIRDVDKENLDGDKRRNFLFERLYEPYRNNVKQEKRFIVEKEVNALLRGDIPYFYTKGDSKGLFADGEEIIADYFDLSAVENAEARLDNLSEEDKNFEIAMLRNSMNRVILKAEEGKDIRYIGRNHRETKSRYLSAAEDIFDTVYKDMIVSTSGNPLWFGIDSKINTATQIMGYGFCDGYMGVAAFLSALSSKTENITIKEKSETICREILNEMKMQFDVMKAYGYGRKTAADVSFASGIAGALFSLELIAKYIPETEKDAYTLCEEMIGYFSGISFEIYRTDLITGLSGLLKVLCRSDTLYNKTGSQKIINDILDVILSRRKYEVDGHRLWKTINAKEKAISGMGHGQIGIASALRCAEKRLCRTDLHEAVETALRYEKSVYSNEIGGWIDYREGTSENSSMNGYCSGAPGIGIESIDLLNQYDGMAGYTDILTLADNNLETAKRSCINRELMYKDHLCCGKMAVAEFLLRAGANQRNDEEKMLMQKGRDIISEVIDRGWEEGHYHLQISKISPYLNSGLYYGITGIGYEILRYEDPENICSVLL